MTALPAARMHESPSPRVHEPSDPAGTLGRSRRALGLLLCFFVVAFTAHATADRATWLGIEGPPCPVGARFGAKACPGCGLTRSVCLAAHGRWHASFRMHPAGLWVLFWAVASALVHAHALWRRRRTRTHLVALTLLQRAFSVSVLVGFVARLF